jgi:uncharacterized membrane protein YcjF (UPF0283 family)
VNTSTTNARRGGSAPKATSAFWPLAAAVLLLVLVVAGCVLSLGDRLAAVHPLLAALLYLVVTVVLVMGVAVPVARVLRHPVYALADLTDDAGRPRHGRCRRFVEALVSNPELDADERAALRACLDGSADEAARVAEQFERIVVPRLDADIRKAATSAFACTAISQSSVVDGFTVLSINANLVRSLVETCGFRPRGVALLRLYVRVLGCSLVASGLEELDAEEMLASVLGGGALGRTSGIVTASVAQGLANAFLVLRVGSVAKGYLRSGSRASQAELRRASYAEALAVMRRGDFTAGLAALVKRAAASVTSAAAADVRDAAASAGRTVKDAVEKATARRIGPRQP